MKQMKSKLQTVGGIWALDIVSLIIFAGFLKWI
jgi:hypothetical protein